MLKVMVSLRNIIFFFKKVVLFAYENWANVGYNGLSLSYLPVLDLLVFLRNIKENLFRCDY